MMVPFSAIVMWTFGKKIGNSWKKILWYSGKIAFIFSISIAFCVESVEQTVRELAEVGVECEPIRVDDYTGKKMTFFHDPDGLPLELHE